MIGELSHATENIDFVDETHIEARGAVGPYFCYFYNGITATGASKKIRILGLKRLSTLASPTI
jgi:hypothetical protein